MKQGRKTIDKEKFHKLRVAIRDKYGTITELAEDIGVTRSLLSYRLNGNAPWAIHEVYDMCHRLDIAPRDIFEYFPPEDYRRHTK